MTAESLQQRSGAKQVLVFFSFLFFFFPKASCLDKSSQFSCSLSWAGSFLPPAVLGGDCSGPVAYTLDEGKCPFAEKSGWGPAVEVGTQQRPALEHSESLTLSLLLGQETLWSLSSPCSRLMPKIIHPKQQGLITRAVNSLISLFWPWKKDLPSAVKRQESKTCIASQRHPAREAMSSLYTRSKEYARSRKAQSDSPPSSPSPIAKTLRVSSFFLSVLHRDLLGTCSEQRLVVVVCCLTLGDLCLWFALERGWFKWNLGRCLCSNRF